MHRLDSFGRRAFFGLTCALGLAIAGCGKPPPRTPNPTKPVSDRRAAEIIAKALHKEKLEAEEGRDVKTVSGPILHVDVGVAGHKYGIAYLTENDLARDDADRLPTKDPKRPRALVLAQGAGKGESTTFILMLFDRDYLFDDQVGEEHEQTSITAEASIERDVRDFVVQAKSNSWE